MKVVILSILLAIFMIISFVTSMFLIFGQGSKCVGSNIPRSSQELLKDRPTFYYINMEKSVERRERMEKQFREHSLTFKRVEAIDGRKVPVLDDRLSPSEYGCTLSHLKAIEEFANSGEEIGIICEDDLSFEFMPYWKMSIQEIIQNAPKDWEIISLAFIIPPQRQKLLNKLYNPYLSCRYFSALSYVINKKGAGEILALHRYKKPNLMNFHIKPIADIIVYHLATTYFFKYSIFTYPENNDSTIRTQDLPSHFQSKKVAKKSIQKWK